VRRVRVILSIRQIIRLFYEDLTIAENSEKKKDRRIKTNKK